MTSGGAQKAGGRHSRDVNFASDLDYVRGIHSIRVGTAFDFNSFRSDESDNYLGTYTFESLETFDARRPRSYTRRIGEPERQLREPAGRVLRAGRHPDPAKSVDHAGCARRSAESHQRRRRRTEIRCHMGAVPERENDVAGELGNFLRLAGDEHVRTDAPYRRVPAARDQHRRSLVSRCPRWRSRAWRRPIAICSIPALKHPGIHASARESITHFRSGIE